MASIQKRKDGAKPWVARYRDKNGQEHSRRFAFKNNANKPDESAQHWLDQQTAKLVTGTYITPDAGQETFKAYALEWLARHDARESTIKLYERHLRLRVFPTIGHLPLASLTSETMESLLATIRKDFAASSAATVFKVVSAVLNSAVRGRRIAVSPAVGVKRPKVSQSRVRAMTREQLDHIVAEMRPDLRALAIVGAATGMRRGELLGLTMDRLTLDGDRPEVEVDRQLLGRDGNKPVFGPLKTDSSPRTLPLPKTAVKAIRDHVAEFGTGERGLLFTIQKRPVSTSRIWDLWHAAAVGAGLDERTGMGLHALRHFYATTLIRGGASVTVVQKRLGHKTAKETLDTYSHLWHDDDERTRAAIDDVLKGIGDPLPAPRQLRAV